ncbi:MAG: hypothetical protein QNK30_02955 [Bacteroidales bacterium]|nr:hypothetical protein [Bacteroidales bacterium]
MNFLRLLPVIISFILLGAHFSRIGISGLSIVFILFPLLLFIKHPIVARLTQVILVLGAIEWIRTTIMYVNIRQENGEDWIRLAIILGIVALFTGLSSLSFQGSSIKKLYTQ